jgi:DNA-binding NtrC family response regulator
MFILLSTLDRAGPRALKCDMASPGQEMSIQDIEREHIKSVLRFTKGNKREAARMLKISRGTLYRRLKDYGLERLIRRPMDNLDDL